ncbi:MAG: glycosyltransferase [Lachnospiraceae bacterium]|nr:glycosyltransferase [Lachnospiraceae bacterium]
MKKGIVLYAYGDNSWIGGLYYIKNIAFMLSINNKITTKYNIYIFVEEKNAEVFYGLPKCIQLIIKENKEDFGKKTFLLSFYLRKRVKYLYPSKKKSSFLNIKSIAWIPDFQHNNLPEMFSEEERVMRTAEYQELAQSNIALVLSSNACKNDFEKFYKEDKQNVVVVPFVSYIEQEINDLDIQYEEDVLDKFNLKFEKYIYIGNQFWKHKNHIVVLKAIDLYLQKNPDSKVKFVFTGKMEDYRNPEYSEEIKTMFSAQAISGHAVNLGFIERKEQIVIMKHAQFLIQPSLFEGWGTVVEDAKVLDKTIILSDIEVHREQKNAKCFLFDPYDERQLEELIHHRLMEMSQDSIDLGIKDMYERALAYSECFFELLEKYK